MTPQAPEAARRDRWRAASSRLLTPVFEGGPQGQRRAALMFLIWLAPVALLVVTIVSPHPSVPTLLARWAGLALITGWVALRPRLSRLEWTVLLAMLSVANTVGQFSAGPQHNGVAALNMVGVFVMVCVAFESELVLFTAVVLTVCYAVVQFHFYGAGDALAATLLYIVVISVLTLVVHGTSLYLREALRQANALRVRVEQAAEEERARIAGELHDDTIQVLTAAGLQLDDITRRLEAEDSQRVGAVRSVRAMLGGALERTRTLSFQLYPPRLDRRGLDAALDSLGQEVAAISDFRVEVSATTQALPIDVERLAYRTVRELLANARKHSGASLVRVSVTQEAGALNGVVEDDGRGFGAADRDAARWESHMGLDATEDRLREAGGELRVESRRGGGSRVCFSVPLAAGSVPGRRPAA
jgi:signal transduction histidine kinase